MRFCLRERLFLFRHPERDYQPLHRTIPRCSTSQVRIKPRRNPAAWRLHALHNRIRTEIDNVVGNFSKIDAAETAICDRIEDSDKGGCNAERLAFIGPRRPWLHLNRSTFKTISLHEPKPAILSFCFGNPSPLATALLRTPRTTSAT